LGIPDRRMAVRLLRAGLRRSHLRLGAVEPGVRPVGRRVPRGPRAHARPARADPASRLAGVAARTARDPHRRRDSGCRDDHVRPRARPVARRVRQHRGADHAGVLPAAHTRRAPAQRDRVLRHRVRGVDRGLSRDHAAAAALPRGGAPGTARRSAARRGAAAAEIAAQSAFPVQRAQRPALAHRRRAEPGARRGDAPRAHAALHARVQRRRPRDARARARDGG